ncbi:alpha-ketoglutarate decarboxylase [Lacinutrix undariae]
MYYTSSKVKFLIAFLLTITAGLSAQNSSSPPNEFWKNVRFGGSAGAGFTNDFFSITIAPSAIYDFNDYFSLGVGLNGTYNSRKNVYKSTIIGGSLIGFFNPINDIQLSAEFEELNVSRKWDNSAIENENYWYPALFLGAGYRTDNFTIGIRYDVLYNESDSIYATAWMPFARIYF